MRAAKPQPQSKPAKMLIGLEGAHTFCVSSCGAGVPPADTGTWA